MSDDGKLIRLVPRPAKEPPREAIEMLRDMIRRIESGEVATVAVVARGRDEELHTAWNGWSGDLIAPAQLLAARLMSDLRGQ